MAELPKEIKELLEKPNKTDEEGWFLLKWFRENKKLCDEITTGQPFVGDLKPEEPTSTTK